VLSALVAGGEPVGAGRGESALRSRLLGLRGEVGGAETADQVFGLLDRGRLRRPDRLVDLVDRASATVVRTGLDRIIEMPSPLGDLLPGRGLRRGSTVAVQGSTSLLLAMLAAATRAGCWCAVVGRSDLGLVAAAEFGVVLERLALVPDPGPEWPQVVAALLDGIDIVVVAMPATAAVGHACRLTARARQRRAVLVGVGEWLTATLTIEADHGVWYGLGHGRGRLRCRLVNVAVRGGGGGRTPPPGTDVVAIADRAAAYARRVGGRDSPARRRRCRLRGGDCLSRLVSGWAQLTAADDLPAAISAPVTLGWTTRYPERRCHRGSEPGSRGRSARPAR